LQFEAKEKWEENRVLGRKIANFVGDPLLKEKIREIRSLKGKIQENSSQFEDSFIHRRKNLSRIGTKSTFAQESCRSWIIQWRPRGDLERCEQEEKRFPRGGASAGLDHECLPEGMEKLGPNPVLSGQERARRGGPGGGPVRSEYGIHRESRGAIGTWGGGMIRKRENLGKLWVWGNKTQRLDTSQGELN